MIRIIQHTHNTHLYMQDIKKRDNTTGNLLYQFVCFKMFFYFIIVILFNVRLFLIFYFHLFSQFIIPTMYFKNYKTRLPVKQYKVIN